MNDEPGKSSSDVADAQQLPFFAVSIAKLVVLSLCTLNIYQIYWFYWNWRLVKVRERADISPFWRASLAFFYCYRLFQKIRDFAGAEAGGKKIPAALLAVGWVVTSLMWVLPDPAWLISMLAPVLFMVPAQIEANRINAAIAPSHDRNRRFSALNWLAIVIGGAFSLVTVIAALILEDTDVLLRVLDAGSR
jgi:hypothetical protein